MKVGQALVVDELLDRTIQCIRARQIIATSEPPIAVVEAMGKTRSWSKR